MLVFDPTHRITAQDARRHHYFNDLPEALRRVGNDMSQIIIVLQSYEQNTTETSRTQQKQAEHNRNKQNTTETNRSRTEQQRAEQSSRGERRAESNANEGMSQYIFRPEGEEADVRLYLHTSAEYNTTHHVKTQFLLFGKSNICLRKDDKIVTRAREEVYSTILFGNIYGDRKLSVES